MSFHFSFSKKNEENKNGEKVYELKYIKFIVKDYTAFPRTERAKFLIIIRNVPFRISELEEEFGYMLYGFNFEPKDKESFPKNFDNSIQLLINNYTDICFYYLEYRLLFFLDLSQSMLLFDLRQKIFNIQKTEKYLNYLLKSCAQYEDTVYDFKLNKIKYKPKVVCTITSSSIEEEIIFIQHAFILDENNFDKYHSEKISRTINSILSKHYEKKKIKENENRKQILFLYKILENCLSIANLMSGLGCPILFLLTDGNACLPKLGKYNNILMQFNRVDISIQIIDLFYRNNFYGLTSPTYANDIESMKYIAQFTGGNYINENYFITLFFPLEEINDKNKKYTTLFPLDEKKNKINNENHIFFYPSLYPNILNYNTNIEESIQLWAKRFYDYTEKQILCESCTKGFEIFLCKKILLNNKSKNEIILNEKMNVNNIINKGLNIKSIGLLSNKVSVFKKELFESYKITLSIALIIESRLRESFYLKKTKNPKKIKFMLYFLPGIIIKYNLTRENENLLCEDYKVDILLKGDICKLNQMKKEIYENKGKKSEKVELLLNFIKEIICTDKISFYFSQITHINNFLEKDFLINNENFVNKLIGLPVNKWHRFFNVMMCEIFIIDKTIIINKEFIENFLISNEYAIKKCEEKQQYLKNKIFKFCDYYNEKYNFGIKRISKEENIKAILSHNGFLLIKFDWIYKNLCILYLGFFHSFLTTRNKYYKTLKEFIKEENEDKNLLIEIYEKHLTYFLTKQNEEYELDKSQIQINKSNDISTSNNNLNLIKKNNTKNYYEKEKVYKGMKNKINNLYSIFKEVEDYKKNGDSLFTYLASQKLVSMYLKQYQMVYELPFDSDILRDFIGIILLQRLNENFQILNWNKNQMILFSFLTNLNLKINFSSSDIKNNPLLSTIIVLFSIEIIVEENKKLITTKLMFEPNENLFIINRGEKNENINEDKSYFKSIIKYFEESGMKIKEKLKINEQTIQ